MASLRRIEYRSPACTAWSVSSGSGNPQIDRSVECRRNVGSRSRGSGPREGQDIRDPCGSDDHRFIGVWVVMVDERVFIRSWCSSAGAGAPDVPRGSDGNDRGGRPRAARARGDVGTGEDEGSRRRRVRGEVQHSGGAQVCAGLRTIEEETRHDDRARASMTAGCATYGKSINRGGRRGRGALCGAAS